MTTTTAVPVLTAFLDECSVSLRVWCDHCRAAVDGDEPAA